MRYMVLMTMAFLGCQPHTPVTTSSPVNVVTGTVSVDGKLLDYGVMVFIQSDGRKLKSIIDRQGRYSIRGVTTGPVKILVDTTLVPDAFGTGGDTGNNALPKRVTLPGEYLDDTKTPLTFTISAGQQEHHLNIERTNTK